jgi:esterase/lipase superfamily enzyme
VDLPFDGAMLVYSWPSLGEVGPLAYFRDDKTIAASQPMLRAFLERVVERIGAERVSIVAHSMGTLLVARTVKELHDARPELRFDQVVLGAPDIDTTSFRRSLAPALLGSARRLTIYASQHDRALDIAQRASSYPRVGQAGPGLLVLPGIDVIDASTAEEGDFGHGYMGASNAVLADLRAVLAGVPVASRRLERRQRAGLAHWELLGEAR